VRTEGMWRDRKRDRERHAQRDLWEQERVRELEWSRAPGVPSHGGTVTHRGH